MAETKKKITLGAHVDEAGSSAKYKTGSWRVQRPELDMEKCNKCLNCLRYCPDAAVKLTDDGPVIDLDYCKGCGICANECPVKAITMITEAK